MPLGIQERGLSTEVRTTRRFCFVTAAMMPGASTVRQPQSIFVGTKPQQPFSTSSEGRHQWRAYARRFAPLPATALIAVAAAASAPPFFCASRNACNGLGAGVWKGSGVGIGFTVTTASGVAVVTAVAVDIHLRFGLV